MAELAEGLAGTEETRRYGRRAWAVEGRVYAWERPFSKADLRRFGDDPVPAGPILAVRVADLTEKEAALAAEPVALFTIPHFEAYAAVLVRLEVAGRRLLRRLLRDGWEACVAEGPPGRRRTPRPSV